MIKVKDKQLHLNPEHQEQIIQKMIDYLEPREWLQGHLWKVGTGGEPIGCCLMGAWIGGVSSLDVPNMSLFVAFAKKKFNEVSLSKINDDYLKSKEEALQYLRELKAFVVEELKRK